MIRMIIFLQGELKELLNWFWDTEPIKCIHFSDSERRRYERGNVIASWLNNGGRWLLWQGMVYGRVQVCVQYHLSNMLFYPLICFLESPHLPHLYFTLSSLTNLLEYHSQLLKTRLIYDHGYFTAVSNYMVGSWCWYWHIFQTAVTVQVFYINTLDETAVRSLSATDIFIYVTGDYKFNRF